MKDISRFLYIDVAGCNLKCVMCPRGGLGGLQNINTGKMSFEVFQRIIKKFIYEGVSIKELLIGNWGEPLLNPDLPRMIQYLRSVESVRKLDNASIFVSTNLNSLKDAEGLLSSGLNELHVSISGMTQAVYERNHRGGDINIVLRNLVTLVRVRQERNLKGVKLKLRFLKFVYNAHELRMAQSFCRTYGVELFAYKGFVPTVEDNARLYTTNDNFNASYQNYIDLNSAKKVAGTFSRRKRCILRDRYVTINFDGQLYRCCAVFDKKFSLGPIWGYKIAEIPQIKDDVCHLCCQFPMHFKEHIHAVKHKI